MNKSELVEEIARRTDVVPGVVAQVVDGFMEAVTRSVARGEKVVLSRFGTFHRRTSGRRLARNVSTNQPLTVPARNVPAFRPGKPFREAVAKRRAIRGGPGAGRKAAKLGARRGGAAGTAGARGTPTPARGIRSRPA